MRSPPVLGNIAGMDAKRVGRAAARVAGLCGFLAWLGAGLADDKPRVTAVFLAEVREAGDERTVADEPRSKLDLTVVLRIDGLSNPARFGRVIITEAKDDVGTDLVPPRERGQAADTTELPEFTRPVGKPGSNMIEDVPGAFTARVQLRPAARRARRIASLKGEVQLLAARDGKPTVIRVPGIAAWRGKTVEHAELTRAGLTLQVAAAGPGDPPEMGVLLSGQLPRKPDLWVEDAAGQELFTGSGGETGKGTSIQLVKLRRPLRDTDVLTIKFPAVQTPVTVPVVLKDVELP